MAIRSAGTPSRVSDLAAPCIRDDDDGVRAPGVIGGQRRVVAPDLGGRSSGSSRKYRSWMVTTWAARRVGISSGCMDMHNVARSGQSVRPAATRRDAMRG